RAFMSTRVAGPGQPGERRREQWVGPVYVLAALGSAVVVASTFIASRSNGDFALYHFSGRYDDPLTPTLLALGIAALLARWQRPAVVRSLWIASGAILALGLLVIAAIPAHGKVAAV